MSVRVGRRFVWLDDKSIALNKILSVKVDEHFKPVSLSWIGWIGALVPTTLSTGIHPLLYLLPVMSAVMAGVSFYSAAPQTLYHLSVKTVSASTFEAVTTELDQVRHLQSVIANSGTAL